LLLRRLGPADRVGAIEFSLGGSNVNIKQFVIIAVICALCALVPVSGYALFDIGAYGGGNYTEYKPGVTKFDSYGGQYGFVAHLNTTGMDLWVIDLEIGIGGFFDRGNFYYTRNYNGYQVNKTSYGPDIRVLVDIPFIIDPYVRGGAAAGEQLDMTDFSIRGNDGSRGEMGHAWGAYYYGGGIDITFFPFLRFFAEYIRYTSTYKEPRNLTFIQNQLNLGLRLNL